MKFAIAILNWNGEKLLKQFLPSVVASSPQAVIYLIDNASNDGSLNYVEKTFPALQIIALNQNYGYAGGYNKGLVHVKEDVICLLNNDVFVKQGWLEPIINHFKNNPNCAIAQPHIMDFNHPHKFEYAGAAGGYIDRLGYPYCRGRIFNHLEDDRGQYDQNESVFWASGACFFVRKNIFEALGGFDEDFFAHMEEIDFCWRAKNQNMEVYALHESKVYHLGGGTLKPSPEKTYLNFRNSLLMLLKNLPEKIYLRLMERMLWDGVALVFFVLQLKFTFALAVLRAHYFFYLNYSRFKIKRAKNPLYIDYYNLRNLPFRYFFLKKKKL